MKQLTVAVKPFRAEAVRRAAAELGVTSCVVREAKGYSRPLCGGRLPANSAEPIHENPAP
jgi:nitrogen regulatory protein PII